MQEMTSTNPTFAGGSEFGDSKKGEAAETMPTGPQDEGTHYSAHY